jgi:hypothetical protein
MTVAQPDGMGPPFGWTNGHKGEPLVIYLVPPSTNAYVDATSCSEPFNVEDNFGETSPMAVDNKPDFVILIKSIPSGSFVPVESGTSDFPVDLPPLSSWSRNFNPIASGIKDVYVDFTDLSKSAEAYVLAKIDNKYQVFNDTGQDQNFCLDDPKENVTEFTVVIVNHSLGSR